ncbi:Ig-like V-type domain-containing protein FAM187A [Pogonomyrmex barbatus]|uniref:Ig-like V-type domain-containing protein FAM187A n=1 Tax=Pogonomyrmex barbatus TaxID=144034 RepID=A0A6I9WM49_9HYME|nr:Ig-like V-type domain-containing protein FAM187A [Pogonomyrmex barbatus]
MMKICVMFILIYYLSNVSLTLLRSNLNKNEELQKKFNKIFNGKYDNKMFLNIDEYEYPRANESLRHLHRQQWLDYYECLKKTYANMRRDRIIYPSALIALEGTSVILECKICISPIEMHMTLIEWHFNRTSESGNTESMLQDTDHIVNSPDNRYIVIYNVKLEQAGIYWCEIENTMGSVYYLYIDCDSETTNVYSNRTSHALQTALENVREYELKIYTTWTTWSPCSACDIVGIKLRYGYCTVSLVKTEQRYLVDKSVSTMNEIRHLEQDIKKGKKKEVRLIPVIENRKTEIMKRYCKKKCQKNIIFEIRDEKGNILESANNSAGIFSMIQNIPKPLASIIHSVIYEKYNKKVKLVCPGTLNADIPIIWRINNKKIIPSLIKLQSNGRIYINPQMQILFESLKFEDTNIYSCWQNNEIAGIIKLNVVGETEFKLNHHIIIIGAIIIISVVLIMFWRAFKKQIPYTTYQ